ncbi:MAG TPA: sulfatase [Anaerolineales bacterium]|nr:sulfatase [Anaerolineales bacterium]
MKTHPSHLLLWLILVVIIGGCQSTDLSQAKPVRTSDKPNFILIITDDQPVGTMHVMETLNQELIGKGIQFTNGYVTTPLCCPSRASILTGEYAHDHGVLTNRKPNGGAGVFKDEQTLAVWLHDAGYRTGLLGKYMNAYEDLTPVGYVPPGWDEWDALLNGGDDELIRMYLNYSMSENGEIVQYGTKDKDYSTDVIARKGVEFIKDSADQPFFLVLSFFAPHQPYKPAARHNKLFSGEAFTEWRPPSFNEEDVTDKPAWVQNVDSALVDYIDKEYKRSLRTLVAVDEAIADVLDALDDIDQRENTVIIFMSDNGLTWGEHRLTTSKNCPYEECINVPFTISYPALITQPRTESRLVTNLDLAPTLLELAGLPIPATADGTSLIPLLRDDPDLAWRDAILIEHWPTGEGFGDTIPTFYGIRTEAWKYVEYDTGEKELYDLVNDPYELDNQINNPSYTAMIAELAAKLAELKGK